MRELSEEEKNRLRKKIQEQRQQHQEIVRRTVRESDEQDMRMAVGQYRYPHGYTLMGIVLSRIIRTFVETIPGLSFRGKLVLGLLLSIFLPLIIAGILAVLRYIF